MKKKYVSVFILLIFILFAVSLFYRNIYFILFIFAAVLILNKLSNTSKNQ